MASKPTNFSLQLAPTIVVYKGQGRLVFAGSSGFDSNAHLIWIIHSANELGYR